MRSTLLLTALLLAATITPALAQEYGTGVSIDVPQVASGAITLDGNADEAAWDNALVLDPLANWDGDWSGHPEPDIFTEAKLLYAEGALYVHVLVEDIDFMSDPFTDQILLGIDLAYEPGVTDVQTDGSFGGFVDNAPDLGPVTYKIFAGNDSIPSISLNWSTNASPADSGWVDGSFFFDEQTLTWGIELAVLSDAITEGGKIGFNIGGGAAKEEGLDDRGEATYAFYSWQVCDPDTQEDTLWCGAGGTVMSDAHSFATLTFASPVAIEQEQTAEVPSVFELGQNYPNPFNPTTTIEFSMARAGHASLDVFNLLGQRVARLLDEARPAGSYRVTWHAADLTSGTYVYQLRVDGEVVSTRKMMLIK